MLSNAWPYSHDENCTFETSHNTATNLMGLLLHEQFKFDPVRADRYLPKIARNLGSYLRVAVILVYKPNNSWGTRHADYRISLNCTDVFPDMSADKWNSRF